MAYADAVEEALCFGWIDSRPNALDNDRYMQLFSPRPMTHARRLRMLAAEPPVVQQAHITAQSGAHNDL
jgi:uncharacterized protein YdeI (YjbR/CyaY-like superfamily)